MPFGKGLARTLMYALVQYTGFPYYENVRAELGLVGVRLLLRIWNEKQTSQYAIWPVLVPALTVHTPV